MQGFAPDMDGFTRVGFRVECAEVRRQSDHLVAICRFEKCANAAEGTCCLETLQTDKDLWPTWVTEDTIAESASIEYKYFIIKDTGEVQWEGCANRSQDVSWQDRRSILAEFDLPGEQILSGFEVPNLDVPTRIKNYIAPLPQTLTSPEGGSRVSAFDCEMFDNLLNKSLSEFIEQARADRNNRRSRMERQDTLPSGEDACPAEATEIPVASPVPTEVPVASPVHEEELDKIKAQQKFARQTSFQESLRKFSKEGAPKHAKKEAWQKRAQDKSEGELGASSFTSAASGGTSFSLSEDGNVCDPKQESASLNVNSDSGEGAETSSTDGQRQAKNHGAHQEQGSLNSSEIRKQEKYQESLGGELQTSALPRDHVNRFYSCKSDGLSDDDMGDENFKDKSGSVKRSSFESQDEDDCKGDHECQDSVDVRPTVDQCQESEHEAIDPDQISIIGSTISQAEVAQGHFSYDSPDISSKKRTQDGHREEDQHQTPEFYELSFNGSGHCLTGSKPAVYQSSSADSEEEEDHQKRSLLNRVRSTLSLASTATALTRLTKSRPLTLKLTDHDCNDNEVEQKESMRRMIVDLFFLMPIPRVFSTHVSEDFSMDAEHESSLNFSNDAWMRRTMIAVCSTIAGGSVGSACGSFVGGASGAIIAIPSAFFTFGLSIPVGAVVGTGVGFGAGATSGGSLGLFAGLLAGRHLVPDKEANQDDWKVVSDAHDLTKTANLVGA